jgi:hypothetical protein
MVLMTVKTDGTLKDRQYLTPKLTEDDAFSSHTQNGFFVYRLPAVHDLMNVPESQLSTYNELIFEVSVIAGHADGPMTLSCWTGSRNNCRITFRRSVTPVLFYLNPPVVYYDAMVTIGFDPKDTTNVIQDLLSDELPFINFKIGGSLVDFEANVDSDVSLSHWALNSMKGKVGDQPIAKSDKVNLLWETGYSLKQQ